MLQPDSPPQAAGHLLWVSKYSIIWDPLAGWPLPASLALPAVPASLSLVVTGPQLHSPLLSKTPSLCAFAQAVLSAQAAYPSITTTWKIISEGLQWVPTANFAHLLLVTTD